MRSWHASSERLQGTDLPEESDPVSEELIPGEDGNAACRRSRTPQHVSEAVCLRPAFPCVTEDNIIPDAGSPERRAGYAPDTLGYAEEFENMITRERVDAVEDVEGPLVIAHIVVGTVHPRIVDLARDTVRHSGLLPESEEETINLPRREEHVIIHEEEVWCSVGEREGEAPVRRSIDGLLYHAHACIAQPEHWRKYRVAIVVRYEDAPDLRDAEE